MAPSPDATTTPQQLAAELVFLHDCGIEDVYFAEPLAGRTLKASAFLPERPPKQAPVMSRPVAQAAVPVLSPAPAAEPISPSPASPAISVARPHSAADLAAINSIPELIAAIDSTDGAGLKEFATQTVVADGNPASGIMLIGEAPGAEEDIQGKPFIGASGQLLMEAIAHIGLTDRSDYFISNTVFWRPSGNRNPEPYETAFCLPYLHRLIQLVAPKLILILGGQALKALLNTNRGISAMRGQASALDAGGIVVPALATYHPSYLLRSPSNKRLFWGDLLRFREALIREGLQSQ